jgi:hypothetical protein
VLPVPVWKVNASTSYRLPRPVGPRKTRYSSVVPAGAADRPVETSVKVSQPPVTGTVAVPRRVPAGEPARTSRVPPAPAQETRAVSLVALPSAYGLKEIQSPSSVKPTVLPPSAGPCAAVSIPDCAVKCSA